VQGKQVESCLVVLDIDNSKQINDAYGHPAGDTLLRDFASLLEDNIRGSNTLVRLGGEEFVILARNTSVKQCTALAERLRRIVAEHVFRVGQHKIQITTSIGVANLLGLESTNNYYSAADRALYMAKQSGRNRVEVFDLPEGEIKL
jgi:diguanylate cyclase (GGDEF)-like protein